MKFHKVKANFNDCIGKTPLVKLKISAPINIDSNLYAELKSNILTGSKEQHTQLSVIQSKIILFSLSIIEGIQNVVAKESPILTNSNIVL